MCACSMFVCVFNEASFPVFAVNSISCCTCLSVHPILINKSDFMEG
jgi:hypothetical protein